MRNTAKLKNRMISFIENLIYPNCCPCCGSEIADGKIICSRCMCELMQIESVADSENDFNYNLRFLDSVYGAFEYRDTARKAVLNLKNGFGKGFIDAAIYLKENEISKFINISSADLIYAVPASRKSIWEKGFNHADIISERLAELYNLKYTENLIEKTVKTKTQHELSANDRIKNASDSFFISNKSIDISDKNIILCDDVITTGSTVNTCAKLLKLNGAAKVYAFSLCRTKQNYNKKIILT